MVPSASGTLEYFLNKNVRITTPLVATWSSFIHERNRPNPIAARHYQLLMTGIYARRAFLKVRRQNGCAYDVKAGR